MDYNATDCVAAGLVDGGVFTPGTVCPHCDTADVHRWHGTSDGFAIRLGISILRSCSVCGFVWGNRWSGTVPDWNEREGIENGE